MFGTNDVRSFAQLLRNMLTLLIPKCKIRQDRVELLEYKSIDMKGESEGWCTVKPTDAPPPPPPQRKKIITDRPRAVLSLRFHLFYVRCCPIFKCFNFNTSVCPIFHLVKVTELPPV